MSRADERGSTTLELPSHWWGPDVRKKMLILTGLYLIIRLSLTFIFFFFSPHLPLGISLKVVTVAK